MISLNDKDNKHLLTEKYDLTNSNNSFINNVNIIANNIDVIKEFNSKYSDNTLNLIKQFLDAKITSNT